MKASSQEASDNTGYAATRYPEVANREYSERQNITPQGAPHPLRLLSDLRKHYLEDISLSNVRREFKIPLRECLDIFNIPEIRYYFFLFLAVIKAHCHKDFVVNFCDKMMQNYKEVRLTQCVSGIVFSFQDMVKMKWADFSSFHCNCMLVIHIERLLFWTGSMQQYII